VLAFQVQKVVPLTHEAGSGKFEMRDHGLNCYGVFASPSDTQHTKMFSSWDKLLDLEAREYTGPPKHLEWHYAHLSGKKPLTTALDSFGAAYKHPESHQFRPDLNATWLDVAPNVELLIGLPDNGQGSLEKEILEKEIQNANQLLLSSAMPYQYRSRYKDNVAIVNLINVRPPRPQSGSKLAAMTQDTAAVRKT
jgi:hypothetical protein